MATSDAGLLSAVAPCSAEIPHRVLKNRQPTPALFPAGPTRVMRRINVAFRVRHQAEDAARGVADAGHVGRGTIRVGRVGNVRGMVAEGVAKHELPGGVELREDLPVAGDKLPFGVGDGEVQRLDAAEEDAAVAGRAELDPAVFELAGIIPVKCRLRLAVFDRQQQPALEQHLEAVADTQYQLARGLELYQCFLQMMPDLRGKDPPRGDVVPVAKAARDAACSKAKTVSASQSVPGARRMMTRGVGMRSVLEL